MLELKNIVKTYGTGENAVQALRGISITFPQTGIVSILGQSGCGKTTLLNVIGGLDRYDSGELIINGVSTKDFNEKDWNNYRNINLGFVFQSYYLIPHLNVVENVEMPMSLAGLSSKEQHEKAVQALSKVGLGNQLKKKPKQISGGQAQRAAIARAIANNPSIIMADEPTGALDTENSVQVLNILKDIAKNSLVIIVTHNSDLAYQYSDRIIRMSDGQIIADEDLTLTSNDIPVEYDNLIETPIVSEQSIEESNELVDDKIEVVKDEIQSEEVVIESEPVEKENETIVIKEEPINEEKTYSKKKKNLSVFAALRTSLKNLYYKKGRTLLTALAGCLGIISICIILGFNSGFQLYSIQYEKESLSKYPISVSKTQSSLDDIEDIIDEISGNDLGTLDTDAILKILQDESQKMEYSKEKIYVDKVITGIANSLDDLLKENETTEFKKYVDENFDFDLATVKYDYELDFNVYNMQEKETGYSYTQIVAAMDRIKNSISEMSTLLKVLGVNISQDDINVAASAFSSVNLWDALIDDKDIMESQYHLLAGEWPNDNIDENQYEIVLIVDKNNRISDLSLYFLGYIDLMDLLGSLMLNSTELIKNFTGYDLSEQFSSFFAEIQLEYEFEEFIGHQFKLLTNTDYYKLNTETNLYEDMSTNKFYMNSIYENAPTLTISGVIQLNDDVDSGCLNGDIGYTQNLIKYFLNHTNTSGLVQQQIANYNEYKEIIASEGYASYTALIKQIANGEKTQEELTPQEQMLIMQYATTRIKSAIKGVTIPTEGDYENLLKDLCVKDIDSPENIYFYPNSIESVNEIVSFINTYNANCKAAVENGEAEDDYSVDYVNDLETQINSINKMINMITYILVAVTCLAVIVSLCMVAIIMYISVQDRTKEIGILRSMGARKLDIMNIFNSETLVLGLFSGIIGIGIGYALTPLINMILSKQLSINNLIQPIWWHSLVLIGASVVLTIISGLIPAISAARKNPVNALRTE